MSDGEDSARLMERLEKLRVGYARKLQREVQQAERLWQKMLGWPWKVGVVQPLFVKAHHLAGSGTTFGFSGVTEAAGRLERVVDALRTQTSPPTAEQQQAISAAFEELRHAALQPPEPVQPPSQAPAPRAQPPGDDRLIHLVEAEPDEAHYLSLQLGHFGYRVEVIEELASLEEALAEATPAALIVDLGLPEDGVATRLAEITAERPEVPAVFISQHTDFPSRLEAMRVGGKAYFEKPVDVGSLIDKLDRLTRKMPPMPYRVLLIDDDKALSNYYAQVLEEAGVETRAISQPAESLQALSEFRPDLILLDYYMPGCNGPELARVLRQHQAFISVPIVFLSWEPDIDRQLGAIRQGGDEFLTKPIQPEHLIQAVSTRAERSRLLHSYMVRDSLTRLLNHTSLNERLDLELTRAARQRTSLSFAMIDVDHFKGINDAHGHPTGDRVLKSLARLLQQRLRRTDIIGRYGGEEFAVILPDTPEDGATQTMEEVRAAFGQVKHLTYQLEEFQVTFSCGVSSYPHHRRRDAIRQAADDALYKAKTAGRNRVVSDLASQADESEE